MSRKHFEALAAAIAENYQLAKDAGNHDAAAAIARTAGSIARVCANENPRFKDSTFLKACGITMYSSQFWSNLS